MDTQRIHATHPMFVIAAASVTAFSLTGIAVLGGWLPVRMPQTNAPTAIVSEAMPTAPASAVAAPTRSRTDTVTTLNIPTGSTITVKPQQIATPVARSATATTPTPKIAATPTPVSDAPAVAPAVIRSEPAAQRVSTTESGSNESGIWAERSRRADSCVGCGTVESVREVSVPSEGSWIGSVAGGVIGGLLGNQIGRGNGKTLATVAGAVGGAFAGREVEKHVRTDRQYQVTVRFDDGSVQSFTEAGEPILRSGDRVRSSNGRLEAM